MIPYLPQPVWHIGPLAVPAFGVAVGSALVTGYCMVIARATAMGVSSLRAGRIFAVVVLSGLFAGYLWNGGGGMSSTGLAAGSCAGMLACAAAFRSFWTTLDLFAYPVPLTFAVARTGCFFAHDHVGRNSDSFLAVRFPGGAAYDLGLLYALSSAVAAMAIFLVEKRSPSPGVLTGLVLVLLSASRLAILPLGRANLTDYWFAAAMAMTGVAIIFAKRWPGTRGSPPTLATIPSPSPDSPAQSKRHRPTSTPK